MLGIVQILGLREASWKCVENEDLPKQQPKILLLWSCSVLSSRSMWTNVVQLAAEWWNNPVSSKSCNYLISYTTSFNSFPLQFSLERHGLKFFSETRELHNLNLCLENFYLSSTLQNVQNSIGHIFVKSSQHRFKQSVFFNGKSLQVKFHTQTARLNCHGQLSLSD